MVSLEPAKPKENCKRQNGAGYCPFPVLGRNIASGVAIGKAWCARQARLRA